MSEHFSQQQNKNQNETKLNKKSKYELTSTIENNPNKTIRTK